MKNIAKVARHHEFVIIFSSVETYIEEHTVRVERARPTGKVVKESHYLGGELHRDGRAAVLEFDPLSGALVREIWYQHGQLCNEYGPAETSWVKWTPYLGPLAKVCGVVLYRNGWSERYDEITQEV